MTMEWNNRNDWFNSDDRNGNESFEEHNESMRRFRMSHTYALEHNERMREFRKSHVSDLKVKVSRRDLINKMWPFLTINSAKETGGSRVSLEPDKWPSFNPMWRVAPDKFAQN